MKIVFGTNFSDSTNAAMPAVARVAARLKAELHLVHVMNRSTSALPAETVTFIEEACERRLSALVGHLQEEAPNVVVHAAVIHGPTARSLVEYASTNAADLLVLSSEGHGDAPLYRIGGDSERVALEATCPVLVLRQAQVFEEWARGERNLRIMIGLDDSLGSESALEWLSTFRTAGPCDVVGVHVYYRGDARRRYGLKEPPSVIAPDPEAEKLFERDILRRLNNLEGKGAVSARAKLGIGRLADHLLEMAEVEDVDLVVVGTHQRHGISRLTSVSNGALHFGRMAVLCVPPSKDAKPQASSIPTIRRVLIPVDFSTTSSRAVGCGLGLAQHDGGEIILLHVTGSDVVSSENERVLTQRLRKLMPEVSSRSAVSTRTEIVHSSNIPQAICRAAERLSADAVCMGSHGWSGLPRLLLGSVAESVMRTSRVPVIVVRPPNQ